jgi:intraflagellar transport protein 172
VAQSDGSVFVYKLGSEWGEKKSICNKFIQTTDVLSLTWPLSQQNSVVFGLADGKIRIGNLKSNKSATLFQSDSPVLSLTANPQGTAIASGHLDGSICRFFFEDADTDAAQGKLCTCPSVPSQLIWAQDIVAATPDGFTYFFDKDGTLYSV